VRNTKVAKANDANSHRPKPRSFDIELALIRFLTRCKL